MDLVLPGEGSDRVIAMEQEADGYFRAFDAEARAGGRYWFRLDDDKLRPDPASREQEYGAFVNDLRAVARLL